jgi:hypothetical protein
MISARVLLKAYYERLYERMVAQRTLLSVAIDRLLVEEIGLRHFGPLGPDKTRAYREACLAFVTERIEMYNPIGIQYTFDRTVTERAAELEFQINWYNSRSEFEDLVETAGEICRADVSDERLAETADELIDRVGAFPDRSIIAAYVAEPTLLKLPDYVLACAIEQVIRGR